MGYQNLGEFFDLVDRVMGKSQFVSNPAATCRVSTTTMTSLHTPDYHLDAYLDGIKQQFIRLNQELDEARNQRDEYKINCILNFVSEFLVNR